MDLPQLGCLLPEIFHWLSIWNSFLNFALWFFKQVKQQVSLQVLAAPWTGLFLRLEAVKNRKLTQCQSLLLRGCSPVLSVLFIFFSRIYICFLQKAESNRSYLANSRSRTLHMFLNPSHKCYFHFEIRMPN